MKIAIKQIRTKLWYFFSLIMYYNVVTEYSYFYILFFIFSYFYFFYYSIIEVIWFLRNECLSIRMPLYKALQWINRLIDAMHRRFLPSHLLFSSSPFSFPSIFFSFFLFFHFHRFAAESNIDGCVRNDVEAYIIAPRNKRMVIKHAFAPEWRHLCMY